MSDIFDICWNWNWENKRNKEVLEMIDDVIITYDEQAEDTSDSDSGLGLENQIVAGEGERVTPPPSPCCPFPSSGGDETAMTRSHDPGIDTMDVEVDEDNNIILSPSAALPISTNRNQGENLSGNDADNKVEKATSSNARRGRKRKRKRAPKKSKSSLEPSWEADGYEFVGKEVENHKKEIYSCKLLPRVYEGLLILAVVGSRRVSFYHCKPNLKRFRVIEVNDPTEILYSCAWSALEEDKPLLAVGGFEGSIRLLMPCEDKAELGVLRSPEEILDLKFHTTKPDLLFSASKDCSIRLWNIKSRTHVVTFGGEGGHREQVVSIDIHKNGARFLSGGMDFTVKIWDLTDEKVLDAIQESEVDLENGQSTLSVRPFQPIEVHFPQYSTCEIHTEYVDCVEWFGDYILSKSSEGKIVFWKLGKLDESLENCSAIPAIHIHTVISTMEIPNCYMWYLRFTVDHQKTLYCGNEKGELFFSDLINNDLQNINFKKITHNRCTKSIRQVAVSDDGQYVINACDDGTIWEWKKIDCQTKIPRIIMKNESQRC